MTDLDAWHAGHVAYLLGQLDSVVEGSGTMLDHTVVVWLTELATPTHLHYDAFTVRYLRQGGADVTHIRLAEYGIRGNGHMMMLELNNQKIAGAIEGWIREKGLAG